MKIKLLNKLRSYLFLKISLVFTLGFFSIVTFVLLLHRSFFLHPVLPEIHKNAVNYALYIINELGTPPDIEKARQLTEKLQMQIRFESPTFNWASHEDMIGFSDVDLPPYKEVEGTFIGLTRSGLCVKIHRDSGRYLLVVHPREARFKRIVELYLMFIVAFVTSWIIATYFIMNWLLKPVKVLHEGMQQLSKGNMNYEMTTNRSDELGKLVNSFNTMTRRIREMIHARDRLLLDVSHELRSPLTRVKVALELLEDSDTKTTIRDDISEMETMVSELLETERMNSQYGGLKREDTNMLQITQEVCADFQHREPGIKIVSFPDSVSLKVDRERIKILFRNILDNALRYSTPDGYPVEISLREKADESIIAVQDFGSGIPEQELPFIFEPFYRVDKSRSKETGGYGLGMSLSKKIMEAHGGSIEVISRVKVGTTIFLKFKR